jgi:hypothetical protein
MHMHMAASPCTSMRKERRKNNTGLGKPWQERMSLTSHGNYFLMDHKRENRNLGNYATGFSRQACIL